MCAASCRVPTFSQGIQSEAEYRERFNAIAEEKKLPFRFKEDVAGGLPNVPEIELGEIVVAPEQNEAWEKYRTQENFTSILARDICDIRAIEEKRRRQLSDAAATQFITYPSPTFGDDIINMANRAEQIWLQRVSDELQEASLTIFGLQNRHDYEQLSQWIDEGHADPLSRMHFQRMRSHKPPPLSSTSEELATLEKHFKDPQKYASLFPWFPGDTEYSAMFPENFTQRELDHINEQYSEHHPVRLPWTVIERVSEATMTLFGKAMAAKTEAAATIPLRTHNGLEVEWLVKGDAGRWYRVTNIAQHSRYRAAFLAAAKVLRGNADIRVGNETLDPEFRAYTLAMAAAFESGDFLNLLKADLNQSKGNLFLTFFPHEGYWADNMKFPFMFEVGIREKSIQLTEKDAAIFQALEERAASIANAEGVPYIPRAMNPGELGKAAVIFWQYRNGGFIRAYALGEPLGHDYPKRDFIGIEFHRNVIMLDSIYATQDSVTSPDDKIVLPEHEGVEFTTADAAEFYGAHEATHGTGARPDTKSASGRTMSQVYGKHWGLLIEPLADAGAVMVLAEKYRDNPKLLEQKILMAVNRQVRGTTLKARATDPKMLAIPDYAHNLGSMAMAGFLFQEGAIWTNSENSAVQMDVNKVIAAATKFHERLTKFSFSDDLKGFLAFMVENMNAIPDAYVTRVVTVKKKGRRVLIDRSSTVLK